MPGNEIWHSFFEMNLEDIKSVEDVNYLREVLAKCKFPGIHFRRSFERGNKILGKPNDLEREVIKVIEELWPILVYLES